MADRLSKYMRGSAGKISASVSRRIGTITTRSRLKIPMSLSGVGFKIGKVAPPSTRSLHAPIVAGPMVRAAIAGRERGQWGRTLQPMIKPPTMPMIPPSAALSGKGVTGRSMPVFEAKMEVGAVAGRPVPGPLNKDYKLTAKTSNWNAIRDAMQQRAIVYGQEQTLQNIVQYTVGAVYLSTFISRAAAVNVWQESQYVCPFRFGFLFYSGYVDTVQSALTAEDGWMAPRKFWAARIGTLEEEETFVRLTAIGQAISAKATNIEGIETMGLTSTGIEDEREYFPPRQLLEGMSVVESLGEVNVEGAAKFAMNPAAIARASYFYSKGRKPATPVSKYIVLYTAKHAMKVHENPEQMRIRQGKGPYGSFPKQDHFLLHGYNVAIREGWLSHRSRLCLDLLHAELMRDFEIRNAEAQRRSAVMSRHGTAPGMAPRLVKRT